MKNASILSHIEVECVFSLNNSINLIPIPRHRRAGEHQSVLTSDPFHSRPTLVDNPRIPESDPHALVPRQRSVEPPRVHADIVLAKPPAQRAEAVEGEALDHQPLDLPVRVRVTRCPDADQNGRLNKNVNNVRLSDPTHKPLRREAQSPPVGRGEARDNLGGEEIGGEGGEHGGGGEEWFDLLYIKKP